MDLFTSLRITLPSFTITIFCDRIARLTLTRVLGLPQSTEINLRPDRKCRQGFTGAPAAAGGRKNKDRCPCWLPKVGQARSLYGEGRAMSRVWTRRVGGLGGLPTPLAVLSAGGMCSTLNLLPALQKWQLSFFGLFYCP